MCRELDQVVGRVARWRFSLGCVWAVVVIRSRSREPGGTTLRGVVLAGSTVALGLVAYGVVRYPGLRDGTSFWASLAVFLVVVAAYTTAGLVFSRGTTRRASVARRYGLIGGFTVGAAWFAVLLPTPGLKGLVVVPLAVVVFGPVVVAVLAGRAARNTSAGTLAALWTGLVGGLLVFAVWTTVTYATAGRPYDPGLVRDFHASGAPDLATYAVGDNLGSGLVLLLLAPVVALALGSLGARLGDRRG